MICLSSIFFYNFPFTVTQTSTLPIMTPFLVATILVFFHVFSHDFFHFLLYSVLFLYFLLCFDIPVFACSFLPFLLPCILRSFVRSFVCSFVRCFLCSFFHCSLPSFLSSVVSTFRTSVCPSVLPSLVLLSFRFMSLPLSFLHSFFLPLFFPGRHPRYLSPRLIPFFHPLSKFLSDVFTSPAKCTCESACWMKSKLAQFIIKCNVLHGLA